MEVTFRACLNEESLFFNFALHVDALKSDTLKKSHVGSKCIKDWTFENQ